MGSTLTHPPSALLFSCTMNAVRSPIAEGIARHLLSPSIYMASAGVRIGKMDPFAIAVMDEIGIDISAHQAKTFEELDDTSFDLIVTLSSEAHHKALELTRTMAVIVEYWPTIDATVLVHHGSREQILEEYRKVRDSLFARIKKRFDITGGPIV